MKTYKKILLSVISLSLLMGMISALLIIVQVPYTGYVTYTDREPYTDKDCKEVELKYVTEWGDTYSECINEICSGELHSSRVIGNWCEGTEVCLKYKRNCKLEIENIDDEGGEWITGTYSYDRNTEKKDYIRDLSQYVKPQRKEEITWSFAYDPGEDMGCWYKINSIPTKTICDNVIKYKNVEKTKEEIKYCNAWKKLIGRC